MKWQCKYLGKKIVSGHKVLDTSSQFRLVCCWNSDHVPCWMEHPCNQRFAKVLAFKIVDAELIAAEQEPS